MTTYYCDYKNGDDGTGTGATGAPWKTIGKALGVIGAGDTVLLRGSNAANEIYREVSKSCYDANAIIAADTGHSPVVYGSVAYTSWAKTDGQTNVYQSAMTGYTYDVWNGATKLTSVANVAACDAAANSYYFDNPNDLLYVNIGGDAPTSLEVSASAEAIIKANADGITVRGLSFRYAYGPGVRAVNGTGTNLTVQSCTFDSTGGAVNVETTGATVIGCTVTNARGVYANLTAANMRVENCVLSGTTQGVYMVAGTGHVVTGCTISGHNDGVYLNAADGSVEVSHNIIRDNNHSKILIVGGTALIHHNLCYESAVADVYAFGIVTEDGAVTEIYHNTVANSNLSTKEPIAHGQGLYVLLNGATTTARNNAIYNCYIGIQSEIGGWTGSHNAVYACESAVVGGASLGATDVTTDPAFTAAATFDFTLTGSSPLRDAGVVIAGINDGTGGSTHYLGAAPDIGAFEYEGRVRTLTTTGAG